MKSVGVLAILLAIAGTAPAAASKSEADRLLDAFVACESIADAPAKLACFETHLAELKAMRAQSGPLVAARDAARVQRPQRVAFAPIDATIASATDLLDGQWLLVLSDRTIWRTQEAIRFEPMRGDRARVEKGALGSYQVMVGNQHAIKVRPLR